MIVCVFIHQNHRCPDLSPSSLEWSLRTIWVLSPRPQSSFCSKYNLTRNSLIERFLFLSRQHRPRGGTASPATCLQHRASYFLGLQPPVHLQWPGRRLPLRILTGISGMSLAFECIASSLQGSGYGAASTSSLLDSSPNPRLFFYPIRVLPTTSGLGRRTRLPPYSKSRQH